MSPPASRGEGAEGTAFVCPCALGLTLIIIVLLLPAGLVGLARRPTPRR